MDQTQSVPSSQLSNEQIQNFIMQNTIQREICSTNISHLVGEILRRQQAAETQKSTEEPIRLPKLKKIVIPETKTP